MNERIKELALQAGISLSQKDFSYYWVESAEDMEKFAELLVRECAGVCESMQLIGPYKEVQDATLKDASLTIKQHFGITE